MGNIYGGSRLLCHLCNTVIESDSTSVNTTRRLRIDKEDSLTLHDLHHGLYGYRINDKLLLGDSASELKPRAPGFLSKYEFTGHEVTRTSSGKHARNYGIQVGLMVGYNYDRSLFLEIIRIGLDLYVRKCGDELNKDILTYKVVPPVARYASDIKFPVLLCRRSVVFGYSKFVRHAAIPFHFCMVIIPPSHKTQKQPGHEAPAVMLSLDTDDITSWLS